MSRPGTAEKEVPPGCEARNGILARINEREREIERLIQEPHEAAAAWVAKARRVRTPSVVVTPVTERFSPAPHYCLQGLSG